MNTNKKILALDFDGVICDGLLEYFETSKRTYQEIWHSENSAQIEQFREQFYRLRPVVETGWEMPLLLRCLSLGISEQSIFENWHLIVENTVKTENLDPKLLGKKVDQVRDNWIKTDVNNWLSLHRLYPGIKAKINQLINQNMTIYIVSTKEGRFIKEILQQEAIIIPENQIIGKECQRKKHETLRLILKDNNTNPENMSFIEDRIEPLERVHQEADLKGINLSLADWGYNTKVTQLRAKNLGFINLLTLENFTNIC